ncbi:receptor-like protein EIX1 [Salvia divinorum]|uniref:Receptor-like protein EIX1 n=1 Tax=Salvia divinorum TaxID=28513 RepID=A0ABD1HGS5_SALDI
MISDKRIAIKFFVVVLSCVFVTGDAEVRCIESEREALLSFKKGLINKYSILSSWRSDECCKWYGVECSNTTAHVIALDLRGANLRGKIGSSLLELHHLTHLDLSRNDFGGIPIPKFIGSMKQLQYLSLWGSHFSGSIPNHLVNLTNLRSLVLGENDFGGIPIPEFISSMKQLQHLSLWNSNFLGIVPPRLGNLTNLRTLHLSQNDFVTIPPQLWNLTNLCSLDLSFNSLSSISLSGFVLESLEILDLSYNQLNGSIPDMGTFSSLIELQLSVNNFAGSIPLSIGQLSKLQVLDLSSNSLEGLVSKSHFMKLHKLKKLDLSFNPLLNLDIAPDWSPPFQLSDISLIRCNVGPYFPKWIRTQRSFAYLDVRGANIRDEAPTWLWSTSSLLVSISLSGNQISGTIPNLSSTSILYMDVSYNQFSGPIPLLPAYASEILLSGNMFSGSISSICKTRHRDLQYLDLSNNQLTGEVPDCWEKMPILQSLNLANNSFSGEIPPSFGNLEELVALQMHGNDLFGELPYSMRLCQNLILIDLGGNMLTGEIPIWIDQLDGVKILNLRGNKLHGSIPTKICNITVYIDVLDLSLNNLSSIIPDCFNNFSALASKDPTGFYTSLFAPTDNINGSKHYGYSSFQWKGKESEYWDNLEFLKLIDFSSNRLTGNIPKSFSSMRGLRSLNLSRNSLTGYIIPDIGKMEMLDSLDLSHNQLSGNIPTSLARIYTLGFLDLSNNNLSGKIPTGTQLQSFNASAYAKNDGLCGNPLPKCPGESLRPSTTDPVENMDEKDGNILSFMQEVAISMVFGFIFGFWGVVGSFILKKSWRIAFFNMFDAAGDWLYVRVALFVSKWRRS